VVCILFICPILPLFYHFTRDGLIFTRSYWDTWLAVMHNALAFDVGVLPPMKQMMQNDLFYQRYMWFVSLLVAFFVVFSFFYWLRKDWFQPCERSFNIRKPTAGATIKMMLAVGSITFLGSLALIGLLFHFTSNTTDPDSWFTLGNLLQFRIGRIFMHAAYFTFGILVYKWRWVETGTFPGHMVTWGFCFGIAFLCYFPTFGMMHMGPDNLKLTFTLANRFFLNFYTISGLGLTSALAYKYLNRPTPANRNLAVNSYNLYLAHYPFVLAFQLLFVFLPGVPPIFKYVSVCVLSLLCAFSVSQLLIRRFPKLAIGCVFCLFLGMLFIEAA
jgi:hypothetical protein